MGDVNLEIKLSNLDERVIKIEESGGGSGGDGYITSVSNDFNVVNKKLSLSNDVTTKLSKVDTTDNLSVELAKKIDKPASATEGQVLTYKNNEWVADDAKGGIDEPTELEKGIIGGDAWTAKSYTAGSTVIYNNKVYSCIADCGESNLPTDTTYWKETSLSALETSLSALNSKLNYSTNEQIIGAWTNGKPLYRKIINATTPSVNSWIKIYALENNIDVVAIKGYVVNNATNRRFLPYSEGAYYVSLAQSKGNGNGIYCLQNGWANKELFLIFEYIKTTD